MKPVTDRQRAVLTEIHAFHAAHGYAPAYEELRAILGFSAHKGVGDHLEALRLRGLVLWERGQTRTLRLTDAGRAALTVNRPNLCGGCSRPL